MNLKKGDKVKILSGKDRGKIGAVLRVFVDRDAVLIEGLNMVNKRTHPKRQGEKGQTIPLARPIPASRAMLVCGNCKNATRVGYRMEGAKKVRYCKKCESTT